MHVRLLDAEAAATARIGRMLGQQQQQLYSSAALLTGERSRLLTCYVQDYLECVESLPHDMQRNVSVLRELDNKYQGRGRGAAGLGSRWQGACRGSATFPFSRDSLPEPTEGLPSGTGRTGDWVRGPPCPAVGEYFSGVPGVGVGAVRQPPLQTQRLQLPRRGISHFKQQAFVQALACPVPQTLPPRPRTAAGQGPEGVSGRAPAGLRGALPHLTRPHPGVRVLWNVREGGGERPRRQIEGAFLRAPAPAGRRAVRSALLPGESSRPPRAAALAQLFRQNV